jgi:integrase
LREELRGSHVENRKYGLAIWIQIYLGLRAGDLVALRWEDVDLEAGRIHIRRAAVKKTGIVRDYPKGGKQHSHSIPSELLDKLIEAKETQPTNLWPRRRREIVFLIGGRLGDLTAQKSDRAC